MLYLGQHLKFSGAVLIFIVMVERISRKTPYLHNLIANEYTILQSLLSKATSKDNPQTQEECFALFLLKWLQKTITSDFLDNKFKQLYERGIFGYYNPEQENDSESNKQSILNNLIRKFVEVSSLNILNKKQLKNITDLIRDSQYDKSKLYRQQYEALLFLEFCHMFSSVIQWEEFTYERLLVYVRILKKAIEKTWLLSKAKAKIKSQMIHTQPDENFFNSYINYSSESGNNLKKIENFFNDFFQIADVCLDYQQWKSTIYGIKFFEERLWLSLYIRPNQCLDQKLEDNVFGTNNVLNLSYHLKLTKEQQIVSMLYYWYYGLFEGGYANLFFTILHNEPNSRESNAFLRLFAIEKDIKLKKYIQDRYAIYCSQKGIGAPKQIECLRGNPELQETGNNMEYNTDTTLTEPIKRFEKPDNLTDGRITFLSRLLASTNNGKIGLIEKDEQEYLSYFLGGKGKKLIKGQLINWKGSRYSLKYFITKLYTKGAKLKDGSWKIVADTFTVISKGKKKQFKSSTSYSNLNEPNPLNDTDKMNKELIDECIKQAMTATIKEN